MIARSRPDRFDLAIAAVAVAAATFLLWLGFGLTFFWDEWEFITARSLGDPSTWFVPHGEHWSTLPLLAYRALVETVGLGSYVPYHAALVALHVLVVAGVYVLIRRASGPWAALAGASIVAVFGSGFENLFWAFQIGFVGSTALCLGALVLLDAPATTRRALAILAVLLAGLATSGLGLVTAVIVSGEVLLRPSWRRHAWIIAITGMTFAAWFVAVGRLGFGGRGDPFTVDAILNVPATIADGFAGAAGGVFGVGPALGAIPALALLAVVTRRAAAGLVPARVVAILAGLLSLFIIVGLARTGRPEGDAPRLVYFAGAMLLVAISALGGTPRLSAHSTTRTVALAGTTLVVILSLVWNAALLVSGASLFAQRADITRALVRLELNPTPVPGFDRSKPQIITPSAELLERIVAKYGSPLTDRLAPVPPVSPAAQAKAEAYLFESGPIPVP